ncbi:DUF3168 domain-containing protein [Chelatococcus asaccharovorans]|uniref:DUF3168 domain-containing protein n=1 Tax=Chelatococcus asaccharovorans TaxID=28210 RepID=UPI00224C7350|nr:DUF3168 domain-containing protein [Chelatococcus asaccharovorans]CAH1671140.1 conserved hypothetical protein [Chelatococcus asaccharovorans]CAH1677415.1 conserved hypothetical protein [Chelatococcus asaccharovorans]
MSDPFGDPSPAELASPVLALRRAIVTCLAADADLTNLLGGARIHDAVPRAATGVFVVFGEVRCRDWSTMTDRGHEQDISLTVWSKTGGARPALAAAARIERLLHDAPLPLEGHRLINLRFTSSETRRDERADLARVTVRLRAVTECLAGP